MRVAIVGKTGFLGRALADLADDPLLISSRALDRADNLAPLQSQIAEVDTLVLAAMIAPDGETGITSVDKQQVWEHLLPRNRAWMEKILRLCDANSNLRIVCLSSDSVYPYGMHAYHEEDATSDDLPYARTHLLRENLLRERVACDKLLIARLSQVYGVADPHHAYGPSRMLRTAFQDGKVFLYGKGEENRNHIDCTDTARAITHCIRHRVSGILNIAAPQSISFRQIAEWIQALEPRISRVSLVRRQAIKHRFLDTKRLSNVCAHLAFRPLEQRIREMWMQMNTGDQQ